MNKSKLQKRFLLPAISLMLVFSMVAPLLPVVGTAFSETVYAAPPTLHSPEFGFAEALAANPGLWGTANLTMPVVSTADTDRISEFVFIEVPTDTDMDGQRDLIRIHLTRPAGTGTYDAPGAFRVPTGIAISPYTGTGQDITAELYHFSECKERNYPLNLGFNTMGLTYNDIRSSKPRAWDPIWWGPDGEFNDGAFSYTDDCGCVRHVPASRGPRPIGPAGRLMNPLPMPSGLYHQSMARGHAYIVSASYAGMLAQDRTVAQGGGPLVPDHARGHNQGLPRSGDVEEAVLAAAITAWLMGEVRGYADWEATQEVTAFWSNGNSWMMGTSYPGTLSYKAATAGRAGLRVIFPAVAPVSYYQYYRQNGGMFGSVQEHGSESSWISAYIIPQSIAWPSNALVTNNSTIPTVAHAQRLLNEFDRYVACLARLPNPHGDPRTAEDRDSGNFNTLWDTRNFIRDVEHLSAGIIKHHSLMDYNVDFSGTDMLYRMVAHHNAANPGNRKELRLIIYHQQHTAANNQFIDGGNIANPMSIMEMQLRWLDYYTWGIDNNALTSGSPHDGSGASTVWAVNTVTGLWDAYPSWPIPLSGNNPATNNATRHFLASGAADPGGTLSLTAPPAATLPSITNTLVPEVMLRLGYQEQAPANTAAGNWGDWRLVNPQMATLNARTMRKQRDQIRGDIWQDLLIRGTAEGYGFHTDDRLAFITAPFTDYTLLSGTPVVTLNLTPDHPAGTVSVLIVDVGGPGIDFGGGNIMPNTLNRGILNFGNNNANMFNTAAGARPATVPGGPLDAVPVLSGGVGGLGVGDFTATRFVPREALENFISNHYFVVSRGSVDIQNPNPSGITAVNMSAADGLASGMSAPFTWQSSPAEPGVARQYTFPLDSAHYTFRPGTQLAVYIITDDYRYTNIPNVDGNNPIHHLSVQLNVGANTFIDLPISEALPVQVGADTTPFAFHDLGGLTPAQAADAFRLDHAAILAHTVATVNTTATTNVTGTSTPNPDLVAVRAAWDAYWLLNPLVRAELVTEKALIDELYSAITLAEFQRRVDAFLSVTPLVMNPTNSTYAGNVNSFNFGHGNAVNVLTPATVTTAHREEVFAAYIAWWNLHVDVRRMLDSHTPNPRTHLPALMAAINALEVTEAAAFKTAQAAVLALDPADVDVSDRAAIQAAMNAFNALPLGVRAKLVLEELPHLQALLDAAVIKLEAPEIEFNVAGLLTWDTVTGSTAYELYVNGSASGVFVTPGVDLDTTGLFASGVYTIQIRAIGNGDEIADSELSNTVFLVEGNPAPGEVWFAPVNFPSALSAQVGSDVVLTMGIIYTLPVGFGGLAAGFDFDLDLGLDNGDEYADGNGNDSGNVNGNGVYYNGNGSAGGPNAAEEEKITAISDIAAGISNVKFRTPSTSLDRSGAYGLRLELLKDGVTVASRGLSAAQAIYYEDHGIAWSLILSDVQPSNEGVYSIKVTIDAATPYEHTSPTLTLTVYGEAVTGVTIEGAAIRSMNVGQNLTLTANVTPSYATNTDVTWSSSNENVATVTAGGVVTAVGVGEATITATTVTGGLTASVQVIVSLGQQPPPAGDIGIGGGGVARPSATIPNRNTTFNPAAGGDVTVNITLNGHSVIRVRYDGNNLVRGTDWTEDGGRVTLRESFLRTLPVGTNTIHVHMSGGANLTFFVVVRDGAVQAPPAQPPAPPTGPPVMRPQHAAGAVVTGTTSDNTLLIDGVSHVFPAVNIGGYNFLKLRDVAMILDGTPKSFGVGFNEATNTISITSGAAYVPVGGELTPLEGATQVAIASPQSLTVDGQTVDVAAFNIDGFNYFRLRDLAILLDFAIDFDDVTRVITLHLTVPYGTAPGVQQEPAVENGNGEEEDENGEGDDIDENEDEYDDENDEYDDD